MIIISYYTKNTPYEQEVQKLKSSLQKFNLIYNIFCVENLGSWIRNVQQKPRVIYDALYKFKQDILYVDADAVFCNIPTIFPIKCDFAAHIMDKALWKQNIKNRTHSLMSGTLYFPFKKIVFDIINNWQRECIKTPQKWDQRCLERIYKNYDFYNLPVEYCYIDKTMWGIDNPVIKHNQASRKYRKLIK